MPKGYPLVGRARAFDDEQFEARFWSRVDKSGGPDACWPWTGYIQKAYAGGYGRLNSRSRGGVLLAHRVSYELSIGPISDGLQIDHRCMNRACCNPAHLEAVTQRENIIRGTGKSAQNAAKTHCSEGHEFETVVWPSVGKPVRVCRICDREKAARRRAERKAALCAA